MVRLSKIVLSCLKSDFFLKLAQALKMVPFYNLGNLWNNFNWVFLTCHVLEKAPIRLKFSHVASESID